MKYNLYYYIIQEKNYINGDIYWFDKYYLNDRKQAELFLNVYRKRYKNEYRIVRSIQ